MSDRTRPRRYAAILAFIAMSLAAPVCAQQGVSANDPVTLSSVGTPAEKSQTPVVVTPVDPPKPKDLAQAPGEQMPAAAPTPAAPPARPAAASPLEDKLLGRPNSALSARPIERSSSTDRSALSRLDPRSNEITRVLGALAIVLGLLLLIRTVFKRARRMLPSGGDRPSGVLEVLARYPIGRGQHLVLLKLARRIILVHQSNTGMTALTEMTDPDDVAGLLSRMEAGSSERSAAKFRNALTEFVADHENVRERLPRRAELRGAETEVIDLTRRRPRTIAGFLGQSRKVASS